MSRPPTPPSGPVQFGEERFDYNSTACESGDSYRPGWYHPVKYGEIYNGRYMIIRKIGWGHESTVWLALDHEFMKYVALKIRIANSSDTELVLSTYRKLMGAGAFDSNATHLLGFDDYFEHDGPNGRHGCFAMELMGPPFYGTSYDNLINMCEEFKVNRRTRSQNPGPDPGPSIESGSSMDICNSDESSRSSTGSSSSLDLPPYRLPRSLAKRVLREILVGILDIDPASAPPDTLQNYPTAMRPLVRLDGKVDLWAPTHLIPEEPMSDFLSSKLDPLVKIIDIGTSFYSHVSNEAPRLPATMWAPEVALRVEPTKAVDIWCFGCLVYTYIFNYHLFHEDYYDKTEGATFIEEQDEHMLKFYMALGPLPPIVFQHWPRGSLYFDADGNPKAQAGGGDNNEDASPEDETSNLAGAAQEGGDEDSVSVSWDDFQIENVTPEQRAQRIAAREARRIRNENRTPRLATFASSGLECRPLEVELARNKPKDMEEAEMSEILDMLRWIFNLDWTKRPSAIEILQHPWFQE